MWGFAASGCGGSTSGAEAKSPDADQDSSGGRSATPDCGDLDSCKSKCSGGDAESCEWLGHMHETGDGAPQSYSDAAKYYDQACEGGRDEACAHLAMMYDIGLAVEENAGRAVELYDKACKAGNSWACNREREIE